MLNANLALRSLLHSFLLSLNYYLYDLYDCDAAISLFFKILLFFRGYGYDPLCFYYNKLLRKKFLKIGQYNRFIYTWNNRNIKAICQITNHLIIFQECRRN